MGKIAKFGLLFLLILCLIGVRVFLEPFLYDPLIDYFKSDYLNKPIPDLNWSLYMLNLSFRFFINTIISLSILYVIFNKKSVIRFSSKVYVITFLILMISFFLVIKYQLIDGYLVIFYIRRFLIHPIILLLLIPAFYYQRLTFKRSDN